MIRAIVVCALIYFAVWAALAQGHQHPPGDGDIHDRFYSTWKVPNKGMPRISNCCSLKDCYPTEVRNRGGNWEFRRREDGAWLRIPDSRIEQFQIDPRESPDNRSHVCAAAPPSVNVYCFTFGSGI